MNDDLAEYRQKRDFKATPEPEKGGKTGSEPIFVVQKHDASSLHYDLRLEIDGALKSWAVPKGPSLDPTQKRLAMETEDHPISYAEFEGVIPEEEYGGGTVIVWDRGTYEHTTGEDNPVSFKEAYEQGEIKFRLRGDKLQGEFVLVKTKQQPNSWLLIKHRDEYADARKNPVSSRPESVLSGQGIEEMAENGS